MAIPWGAIISAGTALASSYANNRAANKQQQAANTYAQDRFNQDNQQSQQNTLIQQAQMQDRGLMDRALLDLKRREFSESARAKRAKQAVLGDVIKNITAVKANRPSGVPNISFSGGLTPDALSSIARMSGDQLGRQALAALMSGDTFENVPLPSLKVLPTANPTPLPKESTLDKVLGVAGMAGSAYDAYRIASQNNQQPTLAANMIASNQRQIPYSFRPLPASGTMPAVTPNRP